MPKLKNSKPKYPPFLDTQKLREVKRAAEVYASATGNLAILSPLTLALEEAEKWEDPADVAECIVCGERISKGRKYCGFDCAETDGAIEK